MAMIDYGSVVKKNGVIIQKDMFMDMKEDLGFVINKAPYSYKTNVYDDNYNVIGQEVVNTDLDINGNYFSYIGDKEFLICIYKGLLQVLVNGKIVYTNHDLFPKEELPYQHQSLRLNIEGVRISIKRLTEDRQRYKLRLIYKGDLYECLYGYGVDVNKNYWYYKNDKEKRKVLEWYR